MNSRVQRKRAGKDECLSSRGEINFISFALCPVWILHIVRAIHHIGEGRSVSQAADSIANLFSETPLQTHAEIMLSS
jgi:hypothetical protein